MMAFVLLVILTWNRVTTDCDGGTEQTSITHYRLLATVRRVGDTICTDALGQAVICPGTIPGPPMEFLPPIPDPGPNATTVSVTADPIGNPGILPLCSPAPCFTAWPWGEFARAYDGAGNQSSGACP
jgi:hypothetical protein